MGFFDDKYIVKIAVGEYHTLFLEDNGIVWAAGYDKLNYALGWAPKGGIAAVEHVYLPKAIPYFLNNNISMTVLFYSKIAL